MKKTSFIFLILAIVCFIISILITIGKNYIKDNSKINVPIVDDEQLIEDTNENNKNNYQCIKEENNSYETIKYSYEISADEDNIITNVLHLKQYIYNDIENYYYRIYYLQDKNVKYEIDDDNYTVTINSYDEALIDEDGNTLEIDVDSYISDLVNSGYNCSKYSND